MCVMCKVKEADEIVQRLLKALRGDGAINPARIEAQLTGVGAVLAELAQKVDEMRAEPPDMVVFLRRGAEDEDKPDRSAMH